MCSSDLELLTEVVADVPDEWLTDEPGFDGPDAVRRAYVEVLLERAATVERRITLGERAGEEPSKAPEWLRVWVDGKASQ